MEDFREAGGVPDGGKIAGSVVVHTDELPQEVQERYIVTGRLGEGAYGIVLDAVRRKRPRHRVALKRCVGCLDASDPVTLQRVYREVAVLRQLQHDNIVALRDLVLPASSSDLFLVFNVVPLDLEKAIRQDIVRTLEQYQSVTVQLLRALKYLHAARLLHRDVKPANVLVDSEGHVRLCDFGFVRRIGMYPRGLTVYVGMRWYRAPELLLGSARYGPGVDIWALGCVLGEMLLGRPLLMGSSSEEQLGLAIGLVFGRRATEEEVDISGMPEAAALLAAVQPIGQTLEVRLQGQDPSWAPAADFVRRCVQVSPDDRPLARDLLLHPFLSDLREDGDSLEWSEPVELPLPDDRLHDPGEYLAALEDEVRAAQRLWASHPDAASAAAASSTSSSSSESDDSLEDENRTL